ncbi:hypothetical protein ABPG74_018154 [Tetrahymena malaccensis]
MLLKQSLILFSIIRLVTFSVLIGVSSQVYKQHWCDDSQNYKTMVFSILGLIGIIVFFILMMVLEFEDDQIKRGIHVMTVVANFVFYLILSFQSMNCAGLETVFIIYAITEIVLLYPQLTQIQANHEKERFLKISIYLLLIDLRIIFNNFYQKQVGFSKISNALLVFLVILCVLKLVLLVLINDELLGILLYAIYGANLICSIIPFFCSQKPSDIVFCGLLAFFFIIVDWAFSHFILQEARLDRDLEIYYAINLVIGFAGIIFYSVDDFQNHSLKVCGQTFAALTILSSHIIPNIQMNKQLQEEVGLFVSIVNILFAITLGCLTVNGTAYFIDNIAYSTIYGVFTLIFILIISNKIIERNQVKEGGAQEDVKKIEFSLF